MPTTKFSSIKQRTPSILTELVLIGDDDLIIKLEVPTLDKQRSSIVVMTLAKHFMQDSNEINAIDDFLKQLKLKYSSIELKNNKGKVYPFEINTRLSNSISKVIKGLIVLKMIEDGKINLAKK